MHSKFIPIWHLEYYTVLKYLFYLFIYWRTSRDITQLRTLSTLDAHVFNNQGVIHIVLVWSSKYILRQLECVGGGGGCGWRENHTAVSPPVLLRLMTTEGRHRDKKYDQSHRFYFGVIGNTCFLFSSAQWTKNKIGRIPNRGKLIMLKSNANKKMFVKFLTKKFSSIKNAIIC